MTGILQKQIIHIVLIAILGLLVYSNTFTVPFHFDDNPNIVENYKLRYLNNSWPPSGSRWFGYLTFALNYYFGGLNVTGYHIVNIAIHILNAILVYWFVVFTFRTPFFSNQQSAISSQDNLKPYLLLFIALIFVAHPIQTQAVTYIVQRFTSLATMFYLLSLVMYIKWRESRGQRAEGREQRATTNEQQVKCYAPSAMLYAISIISAILAMKTKEIAFTLPIIISLYEFMFFGNNRLVIPVKTGIQDKNEMDSCLRRNDRVESGYKRLLYLIPFLLTSLIIPLSLIGTDKPIGDAIGELREAFQETEEVPRWGYLFTQFRVIVTYIRLLVLPINQNLDYDYPLYHSFFNPEVFLSFLLLLLIFSLGIYLLHSKRYKLSATRLTAFGIFWFFITLSVESSIIPIRDVIFEHRLYMPSVGIFIAAVASIFVFADSFKYKWPQTGKAIISVFVFIVIILSGVTCARNIIWQDEVSLWEDVVRKSPQKARGHNNLGIAYKDKGLTDKAIEHYQIALRINPNYAEAHNNLGNDYKNKGLTDMAIEQYQIALKLKPNYAEAYNNLAIAYGKRGLHYEAIKEFQTALRLNPNDADAHYNLGIAYRDTGWVDKAIEHYQIALRLNPDYIEAHNNLGIAYKDKGLTDKAIEHYLIALKLNPNSAEVYNNLGNAYYNKGLTDMAIEQYQIALRINPDSAEAHYNLGVTYERKGLLDEAIKQYQTALSLNPKNETARNNLNKILQVKKH